MPHPKRNHVALRHRPFEAPQAPRRADADLCFRPRLWGRNKGIESTHLFAIADYFRVNPRWLATGAGPKWTEIPMDLSKHVHPTVGEVLHKFEEVTARREQMRESERIELYTWLTGERPSPQEPAALQNTG
ncbi:hypothetical protein [Variovorax boronicumulans]|uniref:hypothetical protein n=1 Tax=Variovorax boronicumulans TaxID=436515 RepID=UPI0027D7F334|nr:hypothetical protein [Variovorax boronicumulans]